MSIENKEGFSRFIQSRGSYSMIPNELWELEELDTFEKVLWAYVVSKKPDWKSSRNNLSKNLKITREKVSSAIKKLERLNMLEVLRGPSKSWSFRLVTPDNWLVQPPTTGQSHRPTLGGDAAYTKEYKTQKSKKPFSQEGSVSCAAMGAEGDQRKTGNAHLPGKNEAQENSPFISPEAESIHRELVARGTTPADLNGMSLIEYANQRAYADGYKRIDTAELIKQWQSQTAEWNVEEVMVAVGIGDDES